MSLATPGTSFVAGVSAGSPIYLQGSLNYFARNATFLSGGYVVARLYVQNWQTGTSQVAYARYYVLQEAAL
jgi:hypothetical protein